MRSKLLLIPSIAALAIGCGATSTGPRDVASAPSAKQASKADDAELLMDELETDSPYEEHKALSPFAQKAVGDFAIHRFSGSFAKQALTLTEEVRAKKGSLIVIDYTLADGKQKTTLRVTHDIGSDRVLRVKEIKDGKETDSSAAAYEAMIERTMFVPDSNDSLVASERATCVVSGQEQDCEKTIYQVSVGDKEAHFLVDRGLDGTDLSGEVIGKDGKIIYKAELVEQGKGGNDAASFASRK
ncbi:MAG: hypothetical protein R3B13_32695 [Polyangiaceae bacterium]